MLKEVVECEECGKKGPKDEIGTCGDWIGTPENGYACPDILCPDCRTGNKDDDTEQKPYQIKGEEMNETNATDENIAYKLLKKGGLLSGHDKCPKCEYAPILNWFNYCPMCVHHFSKQNHLP